MRVTGTILRIWLTALFATLIISCSRGQLPTLPGADLSDITQESHMSESHRLLGWFEIRADASSGITEVTRVRAAAGHMNVTNFLEDSPCDNCLRIESMRKEPDGTWLADVTVEHPFSNPDFTAFDVRGIVMFTSGLEFPSTGVRIASVLLGDGELLNPDGFTALYNPTTGGNGIEGYYPGDMAPSVNPESTVNGFKRHVTTDSSNWRNALYAGDSSTVTYHLSFPDHPIIFGYAIDASWVEPLTSPVEDPITDFPMEANCPEGWKIEIAVLPVGNGLTSEGGSAILRIDVYDWQGYDGGNPPVVECPALFDGVIEAEFVEEANAYTRYTALVENQKLAYGGDFPCLIRRETVENDPVNKPWLDLSAYTVINLWVEPVSDIGEVTPNSFEFSDAGIHTIAAEGDLAYVLFNYSLYEKNVHIFDISDPINPVWQGSFPAHELIDFTAHGGYIYGIGDTNQNFLVYDPDPSLTKNVTFYEYGHFVAMEIVGNYCYLLDEEQTIYCYDISDPVSTFLSGTLQIPEEAEDIAVSGGYAYVLGDDILQIVDIEPFSMAHVVKTLTVDSWPVDMTIVDGYLYAPNAVIDVDPPEMAHVVGEFPSVIGTLDFWNGWLINIRRPVEFYDITDPANPRFVHKLPRENLVEGYCISSDYAYVPNPDSSFDIIDLNPPEAAHVVKMVRALASSRMVLGDGYLFSTGIPDDIAVIDISIPELAHIESIIQDSAPRNLRDMAYKDGYVYIAGGALQIYDVKDACDITMAASLELGTGITDLCILGQILYVAGYSSTYYGSYEWLSVFDIHDPSSPGILNDIRMASSYFHADGDLAATAIKTGPDYNPVAELRVFSLASPDSPELVGELSLKPVQYVRGLVVHNGYVYVRSADDFITVVDIDPPDSPEIVNEIDVYNPQDMYIVDDRLYVTPSGNGIIEIDISVPETASITAGYFRDYSFSQVIVDGDYFYVSQGHDGNNLRIFKFR